MPDHVTRIGVSLAPELLEAFDRFCDRAGYASRSEALRDLARGALVQDKASKDEPLIGSLTVLYDHEAVERDGTFMTIQHEARDRGDVEVVSALHVHIDHDHCLEVIVMRGRASALRSLADSLRAVKGVKHGEIVMTAVPPA
jgi:CopG family nickel-responsive transcriptional regulator